MECRFNRPLERNKRTSRMIAYPSLWSKPQADEIYFVKKLTHFLDAAACSVVSALRMNVA